jgi:predicted small lipoprotein YifL
MLQHIRQILVSTSVLAAGVAALAGCGQKGALMLPTAQRATLQQSIRPATAASAPRSSEPAARTP